MVLEISRVDRLTKTYDLAARFPELDGPFTAADVALVPPRSAPTAATVWSAASVTTGVASVLLAAPDADSTGALVVPASADLWMRVTDSPEAAAKRLERVTVRGGGATLAAPTGTPVVSVNGKTGTAVVLSAADVSGVVATGTGAGGALSGTFPNPGLNASSVESIVTGSTPVKAVLATVPQVARPTLNAQTSVPVMAAPANYTGHTWTNSGTTGTVDLNNTDVPQVWGSQSIKMVTNGADASTCHVTAPVALDMSDRDLVLWVKVDDVTQLRSLEVRLGDATFANFFLHEVESTQTASRLDRYMLSGKWHRLTVPWGTLAATGNLSRGAIKQVRVTPHDYGTGAVTVRVAGFGYQPQPVEYPNGVCCFTFDDGWATGAPVALPILAQYGFPASALPIVDLVGAGSYMDLPTLQSLQNDHGWEIAAHANTVAAHNAAGGFTSLSAQALDDELRLNKKWLLDNGFARPGIDVTAYPQGVYNDTVIAATRLYYGAARSQHSFRRDTLPVSEPHRIRTMNLGSTITLAAAQAAVDEASANRELLIFTIHQLVNPSSTGSTWLPADFTALAAYVASKGMSVKTLGAALRRDGRLEPRDTSAVNPLAGQYFIPVSPTLTSTANNLGTGNLRAIPWRVRRTLKLASLAAEITAAGDAGGKLRLGIYADNGSGYPGALVVDAGQIAADAVATAEVATTVTLQPGIYWLAAVVQSVVTTQPTVRSVAGNYDLPVNIPMGALLPAANQTVLGLSTGGSVVTAALPATFPTTGFLSATGARFILKAA